MRVAAVERSRPPWAGAAASRRKGVLNNPFIIGPEGRIYRSFAAFDSRHLSTLPRTATAHTAARLPSSGELQPAMTPSILRYSSQLGRRTETGRGSGSESGAARSRYFLRRGIGSV
jgi:hypothetical protein